MSQVPEGFQTLTPSLVVENTAKAIELYTKAFGAQELYRMPAPDNSGRIMHACVQIGTSKLFLCDTNPVMGCATPSASSFYVYVENVDAAYKRAKEASIGTEMAPLQDMFWGDRTCTFRDAFGIGWTLASHVRDVSPEEMEKGAKQFAAHKAA